MHELPNRDYVIEKFAQYCRVFATIDNAERLRHLRQLVDKLECQSANPDAAIRSSSLSLPGP